MSSGHGGNVRAYAEATGRDVEEILDFSANINPLGPPAWIRQVIHREIDHLVNYPDPDCAELVATAAAHFGVDPATVIAGNGSSEVLYALLACAKATRAIIPSPAYIDYENCSRQAGLEIEIFPLKPEQGFRVDLAELDRRLLGRAAGTLIFLGQPNNPTGCLVDRAGILALAAKHPEALFVIDEAYADFIADYPSLIPERTPNLVVLYSMTKFFAIPGLRLGLGFAAPELAERLRSHLIPWSVNTFAQAVGVRALQEMATADRQTIHNWGLELRAALAAFPEFEPVPGEANFILAKIVAGPLDAPTLAERLLQKHGIAIRACTNYAGLDASYFRVGVKTDRENRRLLAALRAVLYPETKPLPRRRRARPLMFQGTTSNAGKSLLTAALCRILLQDGVRVAPFKAQNMSLNSFVTADGGEMGRAQVLQAQACRLEPEVRMNPVLLKPNTDTGSQVICMGKPVENMSVKEYIRYKPTLWKRVSDAYDSLAMEMDAVILEGAGSPGEVNLKAHDIVNMKMAAHAEAPVLLVGDIDRGGVFASFIGHAEVMEPWERELLKGFIINRFRGDASLLAEATAYVETSTGRPTLGIVPYVHALGLPEEDSVSFHLASAPKASLPAERVRIGVIVLPHLSNFTDLDALEIEPDVELIKVREAKQLAGLDALLIPGSKNVMGDLAALKANGLAAGITRLAESGTPIVGICGGFQILGRVVHDPHRLESSAGGSEPGLGLLPVETTLAAEKTLRRTAGRHLASGETVIGYEIHHGETHGEGEAVIINPSAGDAPLGIAAPGGKIWGSYLHGLFDADAFRRHWLDQVRQAKGLKPLGTIQAIYDIEPALDRWAAIVRESIDLKAIYRIMGL